MFTNSDVESHVQSLLRNDQSIEIREPLNRSGYIFSPHQRSQAEEGQAKDCEEHFDDDVGNDQESVL